MTDKQTPLDRVQALCATDTCSECWRFTPLSVDDLAGKLGVSTTTVRRLANPEYVPWSALGKMAVALDMPPLALATLLWPDLYEPPPSLPVWARCTDCGARIGIQEHAEDCTIFLASLKQDADHG